jgi:RluA family pseudouridine synthase
MTIPIVYEDKWLLVVNKPAGLLTIPTPKKELRTLTNILNEDLEKRCRAYRLYPCHRLDRETSGLIIYAKGKSVQKKMMEEFWRRDIKKTYIAFVEGRLSKDRGKIDYPIEGKSAISEYKIVEKRKGFSIVEVVPLTGRTNQIRLHFRRLGHPLIGEKKFAFRRDFKLRANRLCLHAKALRFVHPVTGKSINLESELPLGMKNFLEKIC